MKIGVFGGIGPEATGIFYNDLIRRLQDKKLIKNNKGFPPDNREQHPCAGIDL